VSKARELLRRIGTPDAVSWPSFWVVLLANLVITFSTGFDVGATFWLRVLVLVSSQVLCFAWLLFFRAIVLRDAWEKPRPVATVLAFALTGAIRGVVASAIFVVGLGASWSVLPGRVITGAIAAPIILSVVALIVSTTRDYRRVRTELLDQLEQLIAARERVVERMEQGDEVVLVRVEAELTAALIAAEPGARADRLEQFAADVVRPLSHELAQTIPSWSPPPARVGRVRFAAILDRAASGRPLMPLGMVACVSPIYVTFLGGAVGWPGALAYAALALALGAGLLWVLNMMLGFMRGSWPLAVRVAIVVASVAAAGALLGGAIQFAVSGGDYRPPLPASSAFFFCVFGLPIVVARAALQELDSNLRELQQVDAELAWRVKRLHMVQWAQQRGLARALHGPVQSSIAAAVQRLRSRDALDVGSLRSELIGLLDRGASAAGDSWTSGISRVQSTWEGLCGVRLVADGGTPAAIDEDPVCADIAVEIVTEAVSNAVRHGNARSIEVTASEQGQALILTIRDDGSGEAGFDAGLGTRLLDDCSLSWSRGVSDGRMLLNVSLPMDVLR
jgi:hypothetical protein